MLTCGLAILLDNVYIQCLSTKHMYLYCISQQLNKHAEWFSLFPMCNIYVVKVCICVRVCECIYLVTHFLHKVIDEEKVRGRQAR